MTRHRSTFLDTRNITCIKHTQKSHMLVLQRTTKISSTKTHTELLQQNRFYAKVILFESDHTFKRNKGNKMHFSQLSENAPKLEIQRTEDILNMCEPYTS